MSAETEKYTCVLANKSAVDQDHLWATLGEQGHAGEVFIRVLDYSVAPEDMEIHLERSVGLTPTDVRKLAAELLELADIAEDMEKEHE